MFALYAAGGRNRIRANTMTETRPTYHADIAALATERRRAMTDAALTTAHDWARDLRHVAERLTVNLP